MLGNGDPQFSGGPQRADGHFIARRKEGGGGRGEAQQDAGFLPAFGGAVELDLPDKFFLNGDPLRLHDAAIAIQAFVWKANVANGAMAEIEQVIHHPAAHVMPVNEHGGQVRPTKVHTDHIFNSVQNSA